ncbi:MAG: hypothetical protein JW937_06770 [Candidatus Omnitrophica bacterium]|nr:hypothetical protein [Candidatus Omnitrophota bacterium]
MTQSHHPKRFLVRVIALLMAQVFVLSSVGLSWATPERIGPRLFRGSQAAVSEPTPGKKVLFHFPEKGVQALVSCEPASLVEALDVPAEIGRVVSRKTFADSTYTLIHIQDVHAHVEAQENIGAILKHLVETEGIDQVAVEGSAGPIDTFLFSTIPHDEIRKLFAEEALSESLITGPEEVAIAERLPIELYGVEERAKYMENFRAFEELHLNFAQDQEAVAQELGTLRKQEEQSFPAKALNLAQAARAESSESALAGGYLQQLLSQALEQGISLQSYPSFEILSKIQSLEGGIDPEKFREEVEQILPELMQSVQDTQQNAQLLSIVAALSKKDDGAGSLAVFLVELLSAEALRAAGLEQVPRVAQLGALKKELQPQEILVEQRELYAKVMQALLQTDAQRALMEECERTELLQKLITAEASPGEWEQFQAGEVSFPPVASSSYPGTPSSYPGTRSSRAQRRDLWITQGKLRRESARQSEDAIQTARHFYLAAESRNAPLVSNTLKFLNQNDAHAGVLIAGGFHTQGITQLLEEQHISYVVIAPRLTEAYDKTLYMNRMLAHRKQPFTSVPKVAKADQSASDLAFTSLLARYVIGDAGAGLGALTQMSRRLDDLYETHRFDDSDWRSLWEMAVQQSLITHPDIDETAQNRLLRAISVEPGNIPKSLINAGNTLSSLAPEEARRAVMEAIQGLKAFRPSGDIVPATVARLTLAASGTVQRLPEDVDALPSVLFAIPTYNSQAHIYRMLQEVAEEVRTLRTMGVKARVMVVPNAGNQEAVDPVVEEVKHFLRNPEYQDIDLVYKPMVGVGKFGAWGEMLRYGRNEVKAIGRNGREQLAGGLIQGFQPLDDEIYMVDGAPYEALSVLSKSKGPMLVGANVSLVAPPFRRTWRIGEMWRAAQANVLRWELTPPTVANAEREVYAPEKYLRGAFLAFHTEAISPEFFDKLRHFPGIADDLLMTAIFSQYSEDAVYRIPGPPLYFHPAEHDALRWGRLRMWRKLSGERTTIGFFPPDLQRAVQALTVREFDEEMIRRSEGEKFWIRWYQRWLHWVLSNEDQDLTQIDTSGWPRPEKDESVFDLMKSQPRIPRLAVRRLAGALNHVPESKVSDLNPEMIVLRCGDELVLASPDPDRVWSPGMERIEAGLLMERETIDEEGQFELIVRHITNRSGETWRVSEIECQTTTKDAQTVSYDYSWLGEGWIRVRDMEKGIWYWICRNGDVYFLDARGNAVRRDLPKYGLPESLIGAWKEQLEPLMKLNPTMWTDWIHSEGHPGVSDVRQPGLASLNPAPNSFKSQMIQDIELKLHSGVLGRKTRGLDPMEYEITEEADAEIFAEGFLFVEKRMNQARKVGSQIASILDGLTNQNQNYQGTMLIVGGGSGKQTVEILRKYPNLKIRFIEPSRDLMVEARKRLLQFYTDLLGDSQKAATVLADSVEFIEETAETALADDHWLEGVDIFEFSQVLYYINDVHFRDALLKRIVDRLEPAQRLIVSLNSYDSELQDSFGRFRNEFRGPPRAPVTAMEKFLQNAGGTISRHVVEVNIETASEDDLLRVMVFFATEVKAGDQVPPEDVRKMREYIRDNPRLKTPSDWYHMFENVYVIEVSRLHNGHGAEGGLGVPMWTPRMVPVPEAVAGEPSEELPEPSLAVGTSKMVASVILKKAFVNAWNSLRKSAEDGMQERLEITGDAGVAITSKFTNGDGRTAAERFRQTMRAYSSGTNPELPKGGVEIRGNFLKNLAHLVELNIEIELVVRDADGKAVSPTPIQTTLAETVAHAIALHEVPGHMRPLVARGERSPPGDGPGSQSSQMALSADERLAYQSMGGDKFQPLNVAAFLWYQTGYLGWLSGDPTFLRMSVNTQVDTYLQQPGLRWISEDKEFYAQVQNLISEIHAAFLSRAEGATAQLVERAPIYTEPFGISLNTTHRLEAESVFRSEIARQLEDAAALLELLQSAL